MIGIVIVIYKSYEQIIRYVRQELVHITADAATVIVNVGCTDDTSKKIAQELGIPLFEEENQMTDARLSLIHCPENLGYAKGNNLGVRFLLRNFPGIDRFLISNDDIEFLDANVVETLSQRLDEKPDVGCIGPKVIDLNGHYHGPGTHAPTLGETIFRNVGEPVLGIRFFFVPEEEAPWLRSCYADHVTGCFMMLRAESFLKVGMFDDRTFLYWEEEIINARLRSIGQKCYYESSVAIRHYVGKSSSADRPNLLLVKNVIAGAVIFYRDYVGCNALQLAALRLSGALRLTMVHLAIIKRKLLNLK